MAAVLAVALMLLCGNLQSAEGGITGFVTQVRSEESTAPAMAPVITSPAGGSNDTHTAVLSDVSLGTSMDVMPVDLARADDENMAMHLTSAPAPSPEGDDGFDMVEEDDAPALTPSTEEEAPGPVAPGPDAAYPDSDGEHGTLLADVGDDAFPTFNGDQDLSHGEGYGVVNPPPAGGDAQGDSLMAEDSEYELSSPDEGKLVSDVDDTSFPTFNGDEDLSHGEGYGVVNPPPAGGDTQGDSLMAQDSEYNPSPSDEGQLVSDVDDTSFPTFIGDEDLSHGEGYGVVNPPPAGGDTQGDSLMAQDSEYNPSSSDEGQLVSDVDDTSFPTFIGDEDLSHGEGYGVVNPPPAGGDTQGDSFMAGDSVYNPSSSDEGQLVSDVGEKNFVTISEDQDYSRGDGYGVVNPEDEAESGTGTSETTGFTLRKSGPYTPPPQSKKTWLKAKATFYGGMDASGTMSGACGYGNLYASGYGAYTAALSSALFKNGMACGACYEVACSGSAKTCKPGSVLVTVTNFCPPNPGRSAYNGGWCNGVNQHFDLSYPAFVKIADPKAGVVDLNYQRVPCKKTGGIRFTLNGNCKFNLVTITNVGGSGVVTEAYMKGDGMKWAPLSRNWGANWQCRQNYCGKGISIKIVTSDKKVSVSRVAGKDWAFGKTYIGQQVY